jgi:hypothetical protein
MTSLLWHRRSVWPVRDEGSEQFTCWTLIHFIAALSLQISLKVQGSREEKCEWVGPPSFRWWSVWCSPATLVCWSWDFNARVRDKHDTRNYNCFKGNLTTMFPTIPRLRRLVSGISSRRPGFAAWSAHVVSWYTVALGQVYVRVLRFCPVNVIPQWISVLIHDLGYEQ